MLSRVRQLSAQLTFVPNTTKTLFSSINSSKMVRIYNLTGLDADWARRGKADETVL
jgi:hypothetical protein